MKQKPPINISLTKRDLDVLNILWESDDPKTAAQIVKAGPELTMNTVQAVLRKLLKNKLVEIAEIVYSGTVLTRSYKPIISQEIFFLNDVRIPVIKKENFQSIYSFCTPGYRRRYCKNRPGPLRYRRTGTQL